MFIRKLILSISLFIAVPSTALCADQKIGNNEQKQSTLVENYLLPIGLAALAIYIASGVLSDIPVDAESVLAVTALAMPIV